MTPELLFHRLPLPRHPTLSQHYALLKQQLDQELASRGKWKRMPELLDRIHDARVALAGGPPPSTQPRKTALAPP